jgi:hypothetical protein
VHPAFALQMSTSLLLASTIGGGRVLIDALILISRVGFGTLAVGSTGATDIRRAL